VTVLNEYVRFAGEPGLYKITNSTSPFTISKAYRGKSLANDTFSIRPAMLGKRLILLDEDNELVTTGTVDVYYWTYPDPLYHNNDLIFLPSSNYLELRTLRQIPEAKALRPVSFDEIEEAKYLALKLNPTFRRKMHPRGSQGKMMKFSTNPFKAR
jgi:hypothetical protein